MRVDLAAQVNKKPVLIIIIIINILHVDSKHNSGKGNEVAEEVEKTVKFIERFDKFFDMLNVTNYKEYYQKRKFDKSPYRSDTDQMLEVYGQLMYEYFIYSIIIVALKRISPMAQSMGN